MQNIIEIRPVILEIKRAAGHLEKLIFPPRRSDLIHFK
jgi:hypothetical protein